MESMLALQKNLSCLTALALMLGGSALYAEQTEVASWYSKSAPGVQRKTASGEIFDDSKLTCATKKDAFGTKLKVKNLKNGKSVICRVNDRGPHKRLKRRVDLTQNAFKKISDCKQGLAVVSVTKISSPTRKTKVTRTRIHKETKTIIQPHTKITEISPAASKNASRQEFLDANSNQPQPSQNRVSF